MIRNADLALYRAKDGSGNDIRFFEPGFHARAEERRRIELALHGAVDTRRVHPQLPAGGRCRDAARSRASRRCCAGTIPSSARSPRSSSSRSPRRPACSAGSANGCCAPPAARRRPGPRTSRSRSTCRRASCATPASSSPWCRRSPRPGSSRSGSSSKSPRPCSSSSPRPTQKVAPPDPEPRRAPRHGRFRHRLFLARLSAQGRVRHAQDRPQLRPGDVGRRRPESTAIIRAVVALAGSLGMKTVAEGVATEEQLESRPHPRLRPDPGLHLLQAGCGRDREGDARREPQPRRA